MNIEMMGDSKYSYGLAGDWTEWLGDESKLHCFREKKKKEKKNNEIFLVVAFSFLSLCDIFNCNLVVIEVLLFFFFFWR